MTAEELLSLIAGNLLGTAICVVGIVLSLRLTQKEKTASRLYLALFALLLCRSVSGMLYALSEGLAGASTEPLYRWGTFLAQGCDALYYLSLTCLLLRFCGETDWRTNTLFRVSAALCILGLLLTPITAFSNLFSTLMRAALISVARGSRRSCRLFCSWSAWCTFRCVGKS